MSSLALYDVVGTPGVAADISHINSKAQVKVRHGCRQLPVNKGLLLLKHCLTCTVTELSSVERSGQYATWRLSHCLCSVLVEAVILPVYWGALMQQCLLVLPKTCAASYMQPRCSALAVA